MRSWSRRIGGVTIAGGVVAAAAAMVLGQGGPSAPPVAFKPVLSVEQLMEGQERAFKALKSAVLDEKWKDARINAWLLAELANVNRQHANETKYSDFAATMLDASMSLAAELKKKDPKLAAAGISKIGNACNACHDAYQKKH